MAYIGLTLETAQASPEQSELLSALLDSEGFEGILEDTLGITAYIEDTLFEPSKLEAILKTYQLEEVVRIKQTETFADVNWNEEWEKNYQPVQISDNCYIRAPFHPSVEGVEYELVIEPKMSFGTGHHETTHLMMNAVLQHDVAGLTILDMGCGTGVLAILSCKCGAASAVAIDYDPWAYENTIENIDRNNTHNVRAILGGKEMIPSLQFDMILANINRNILLDQMESYKKHCFPGGLLLVSGILHADEPIILRCAQENNFTLLDTQHRKQWSMMKFGRNG